jgi:hypothetical protein
MTTSQEYEEKVKDQISLIDRDGMKAIETAKLYARLALSAAIREQTDVMRRSGARSAITGGTI